MSTKTKISRISKKRAVEIIEGTKGKFFTVEFVKKDGKVRTINCQKVAGATVSKLGYLNVREAKLARAGASSSIRKLNMQTIKSIKTGGMHYKIRK